jgi:hypothetical protein
MSLVDLLPELHSLSRMDKLRLIRLLAEDLAQSEPSGLLEEGRDYPLWSPDRAYDAAAALLRELDADRAGS